MDKDNKDFETLYNLILNFAEKLSKMPDRKITPVGPNLWRVTSDTKDYYIKVGDYLDNKFKNGEEINKSDNQEI